MAQGNLFNTSARIGRAVGQRYGNPERYQERNGWTRRELLKAARHKIAENLLRVYFDEPTKDWRVLCSWIANASIEVYDDYLQFFQRADREMLYAYDLARG